MGENDKLTTHEKQIIQALKERHPYKALEKEAFKYGQLPCMFVEVILSVANGEMIVDMPVIGISACSM